MTAKAYPDLGEMVYESRLSNGLLTRVVTKPGFAKAYAFLAVNYGSMDTRFERAGQWHESPQGTAHYLEHKMFDMPDGNIMQQFAKYGGSPNAFTSYDMTAYYVQCTDHFQENLELLLRYVSTPYFTPESVEKERGIIAQEIQMYEDSADSVVFESLFSVIYAHHPIRNSIAGTVESIAEISAQTLYDAYYGFYTPENMMLCVVGDVEPEQVIALAESILPRDSTPATQRAYGLQEEMVPARKRAERAMEVSMPMFALGFKAEPAGYGQGTMLQEVVGDLSAEILVGESSPLYTKLYEDGLIDSGFSCGFEGLKGASMLTASGDSRAPQTVYDAILEEAARIAREGVDEALFQRLKRSALGRRMRDLDGFESICYRSCAYHFEGVDYFSFPSCFHAVTSDQIVEFLHRTVREERGAISLIWPKK